MKDIYEMFKSGMTTQQIYEAFLAEYEPAKKRHEADLEKARIEAERKAREEKKKAERAARKPAASEYRNRALPRYREALADAFYDYFDFLLPEPLDYDETIPRIEKSIQDFEDSITKAIDMAQPFIDLFLECLDNKSEKADDTIEENNEEDEWDIDLKSSTSIDGKEVSNHSVRLSSSDNLKDEDRRKTFTKYMEDLDQDKEIIRDYLNKLFDK